MTIGGSVFFLCMRLLSLSPLLFAWLHITLSVIFWRGGVLDLGVAHWFALFFAFSCLRCICDLFFVLRNFSLVILSFFF